MELTTNFRAGRQRAHSFDLYSLTYVATGNEDRRNRYYDNPSDNVEAGIGLSWGYLLFRKGFHAFTLRPSVGSHGVQEAVAAQGRQGGRILPK